MAKAAIGKIFRPGRKRASGGTAKERVLGEFTLGATLGIGGYAKVKLGVHRETGQKVALKILFADKHGRISDSKKKQTTRAIDLLMKVSHENVLRLLAYDKECQYPESNGTTTPCMMMALEYANNGELFDYLMFTGFFDEIVARSYFHQLVNGLDAIHSLGYAHRDLKPENLLLDSNYTLKIADFGFATVFTDTKMKTACGTKGYLAPEVLKGNRYQESVDIFAAGIILFITYAGFPPFNDAIPTDWWWNRLENGWKERRKGRLADKKGEWSKHGLFWAAHERTRKFPRNLKDFLLKMLHNDPKERPTIDQIRTEEWSFYTYPKLLVGSKEKKPKHSARKGDRSWFNGPIMSGKECGRYLEKRRNTVRRERAKKVKEQQKDMSAEMASYAKRGDGDSDLPPFDPSKETVVEYQVRTHYAGRIKEVDPDGEFDVDMEDFTEGRFANTPFYFFTKFGAGPVAVAFERVAGRMTNAQVKITPAENKTSIRCSTNTEMPLEAEFEVRQYKLGDMGVVSCKRLRGDPLAFKRIINEFWEAKEVTQVMHVDDELNEDAPSGLAVAESGDLDGVSAKKVQQVDA